MIRTIMLAAILFVLSCSHGSTRELDEQSKEELWERQKTFWQLLASGQIEAWVGLFEDVSDSVCHSSRDYVVRTVGVTLNWLEPGSFGFEIEDCAAKEAVDGAMVRYRYSWHASLQDGTCIDGEGVFNRVWIESASGWIIHGCAFNPLGKWIMLDKVMPSN